MSSGGIRGRHRRQMVGRTRGGSTKPRRVGLSVIVPAAWPTVKAVLDERNWLGVVVLLAVCYLQGTEVAEATMDGDTVVVFAQRRTRRFALSNESAELVRSFLAAFNAETATMLKESKRRHVANVLAAHVEPEVRRRLADDGHRWADAVDVSVLSLRRAGIEQLLGAYPQREYVRAFTRNPRAHPEDLLPPVSLEVMEKLDQAVAPFWEAVAQRLSAPAKKAIASLSERSPGGAAQ